MNLNNVIGSAVESMKREAKATLPAFVQRPVRALFSAARVMRLRVRQYSIASPNERFALLQQQHYGRVRTREDSLGIIGNYDAHEAYPYELYLLKSIAEPSSVDALDFGCGPGRMIRRMSSKCRSVDGVDISTELLAMAPAWLEGIVPVPRLFKNDGLTLAAVPSASYDLVYSTIALQHIPVYSTRLGLFEEFFRVLRPGGHLALQMAFSNLPRQQWPQHAVWSDERWNAPDTNGACDVIITSETIPSVARTFEQCGFRDFEYELGPVPHADAVYTNWIFLYCSKQK